jgi:hypothetical protein
MSVLTERAEILIVEVANDRKAAALVKKQIRAVQEGTVKRSDSEVVLSRAILSAAFTCNIHATVSVAKEAARLILTEKYSAGGLTIRNPSKMLKAGDKLKIVGRRWYGRTHGNTYHAVDIYVNGKLVAEIPKTYGYGEQYVFTARKWLAANGYVVPDKNNLHIWTYCDEHGVDLKYEAEDVKRMKDL